MLRSPGVAGLALLCGSLIVLGCKSIPPSANPKVLKPTFDAGFVLTNAAEQSGIRFTHTHGSRFPLTIVETMGGGSAFFDFDADGFLDVLLVNSGDDFQKPKQQPASKLFRNRGDGTFEDVTAASGIVIEGYAMGCCVGDYDNDGRDDLFVTGFGQNWLFRNETVGAIPKFRDVTREVGIPARAGAWGTGCAFVDVNRDGLLDLYVANYIVYDPKIPYCKSATVLHGCTPNQYKTQRNELYINTGKNRFVDKTEALGAANPEGAGLGVLTLDYDADGWTDLFVANDGTPNALLHNQKGKFKDIGQTAGVAFGEDGTMRAGMGVGTADYNGDGKPDLVITNFQHEPNSLYENKGGSIFEDVSFRAGTGAPCMPFLGFGIAFVDLNGDGRPDLYFGNGHVYDNVDKFDDTAKFEQRDQAFINMGDRFSEVMPETGAITSTTSVSRSVSAGDFDNDGTYDLLINSLGRPARLLKNRHTKPNKWIGLKLVGTKCNRTAIGTRVVCSGGKVVQTQEVRSGGSYLGQSDLRLLFYLGENQEAHTLTIYWYGGKTVTLPITKFNAYITIKE